MTFLCTVKNISVISLWPHLEVVDNYSMGLILDLFLQYKDVLTSLQKKYEIDTVWSQEHVIQNTSRIGIVICCL